MKLREHKKSHQKQFVFKYRKSLAERLRLQFVKVRREIFTNKMQISYASVSISKLEKATEFKDPASIVYFKNLIASLNVRNGKLNDKLDRFERRYVKELQ
jgi:hypothetical protein